MVHIYNEILVSHKRMQFCHLQHGWTWTLGFPGGSDGKLLQCRRPGFNPMCWEDPLEEGTATHSTIPTWRIPMDRGLAGYSPWGHKESDTTK